MFAELAGQVAIVRRHLWIVILVVVLAVGAAYGWLSQQRKMYRATAIILIDRAPPRVLANTQEVVAVGSPGTYSGDQMYFASQYEILRSRAVTAEVLDRVEWPPGSGRPLYQSAHLLDLDEKFPDLSPAQRAKRIAAADLPAILAGRLDVHPVENSLLVAVSLEDPDGELATLVVNSVAAVYRDQNVRHRRTIMSDALKDLQALRLLWDKRALAADDKVRAYEMEHDVGTIPNSKKAIDARVAALESTLTITRIKILDLEQRTNALAPYRKGQKRKRPRYLSSSEILSDAVIRGMRRRISELAARLVALETRYLGKHPSVVSVRAELKALRRSVRREIRAIADSVEGDYERYVKYEAALRLELISTRGQESRLADTEREYQRRVDQRDQYKKQFKALDHRYIETTSSAHVDLNNVRVLEESVGAGLVPPPTLMVFAGALFGGLLLGLLLTFFLEHSDRRIRGWRDVEEKVGLRVLGVLPMLPAGDGKMGARDLTVSLDPRSPLAEAVRTLRTNLLFMAATQKIQTMLVTSAEPSDGKTMVALSTALSLAQNGARVLLVEADLRRPRLAHTLSMEPEKGLTTALLDTEGDLQKYVQKYEKDGLDVIVAGPVPPNPAELLHTERFAELTAAMCAQYDVVLFDSPPTGPVADPFILAGQVDACALVVRAGTTSRHVLRHAAERLADVGANVLGAILNRQEADLDAYSAQGYYQYGGYGSHEPVAEGPPATAES